MIIGTTGHRKIAGFSEGSVLFKNIEKAIENTFTELRPEKVITGMALGIDTLVAETCLQMDIPFHAMCPFKGQELYWSKSDQNHYYDLLSYADTITYTSPYGFAAWKYQVRNERIVDGCDLLVAVYCDGLGGGTKNCLDYAQEKKKRIIVIDPAASDWKKE